MSKEKVAKIMGSSIIAPLFNSDRWDYAYTYRKGNVESKQMNISIFFAHDQLIRVDQNI